MEDVTILLSFYIWATKKKAVQMTGVLCDEKIQKLVAQTLEWEDWPFEVWGAMTLIIITAML